MIRVAHWEHADLLEYLRDRRYEWESEDEKIWLKVSADGDPQMALQLAAPTSTGPHRMYGVTAIPQSWTALQSDEYLLRLLDKWTSYGARQQMASLLAAELKLDAMTALAMSIALSRIVNDQPSDPEEAGLQQSFEQPNILPPQATDKMQKTYLVAGGGYVRLELQGGMLTCQISVPNETSGGFSHPLRGIVRPKYGSARDAAEHLFGWRRAPIIEGEAELIQQALEVPTGDNQTT